MLDAEVTSLAKLFHHLFDLPFGRVAVSGSGHVVSQERTISNVKGINLMTIGNVHITVGDREELRIEAEDNLLPYLETNVFDGQLNLRNRIGVWLRPTCPVHFYVTVKSLESLALSGSGRIEAPDLTADHFRVRLSGHGDIRLGKLNVRRAKMSLSGSGNLHVASSQAEQQDIALSGHGNLRLDRMDAQDVDVRISGSANMTAGAGQVKAQRITVSGAGDYDAVGVQSDTTEVCISGSGSVNVQVRHRLEARITGAGSIRYAGDPAIEKSVSGLGRVVSIG
jgi:hypothetical protein